MVWNISSTEAECFGNKESWLIYYAEYVLSTVMNVFYNLFEWIIEKAINTKHKVKLIYNIGSESEIESDEDQSKVKLGGEFYDDSSDEEEEHENR